MEIPTSNSYFYNTPISYNSSNAALYQSSVQAGGGLPTSLGGTMNSTLLATSLGLNADPYNPTTGSSGSALGVNYAASGATVTGNLNGSLAPSVTSQIATYLASTGGVANANALYLLSGGGNDIKIANNLTTAQGDAYMESEANAFAASIETLHADGAKYILIDNSTGTNGFGAIFNNTLDSDLAANGVPFIDGNTQQLVASIEANPSGTLYGATYDFNNVAAPPKVTASTPYSPTDGGADLNPVPTGNGEIPNSWSLYATSLTSANAGTTDLWSDDEHLAAEGQIIEADYYENLINSATPTVGETFTASSSEILGSGSGSYTYQWQVLAAGQSSWSNVANQTGTTFVVSNADIGDELRVETTYTDSGTGAVVSAFSAPTLATMPCYCAGTLILTDRGEVAVERLAIGDKVVTISGESREIKWMGTRSFDGRFVGENRDILPIRIRAGALGENAPRRDLLISPHHALYLEGVLIEAKDLVNGVSIIQAEKVERVDYFHIQLEFHDVIFAEGAQAESFIDNDSRAMFSNAGEYDDLYPQEKARRIPSFAPRYDAGFELEAAREKIAARAGISVELSSPGQLVGAIDHLASGVMWGWAQNFADPETPVCLIIQADGRMVGCVLANKFREDRKAETGGAGRNGFIFQAPEGLDLTLATIELRRAADGALLAEPRRQAA